MHRVHVLYLLCILPILGCTRLTNNYNGRALTCGGWPQGQGHLVQIFDPQNLPLKGHQLTGAILDAGVVQASIDFTPQGCFEVPDRGTVIIRSQDLKLSRSIEAEDLRTLSKLILDGDSDSGLFPSEPLSDKRVYFGQTFYFVDPGYVLNFYSDENLKNFEIEYCLDEIKDPDTYDFTTVPCSQPRYYFLEDLPQLEKGLWSVHYRKRSKLNDSEWSRYLLAVRVDCEGVLYDLKKLRADRCTDIDNVSIQGPGDLENLTYLSRVTGTLEINENDATSLRGLRNIVSVGDLNIFRMNALKTFDIPPLSVKGTVFMLNPALEDLDGLSHLTRIERDLWLLYNSALHSIAGLRNIRSIGGGLSLNDNESLEHLDALSQLETIGGELEISFSGAFPSLKGLNSLQRVGVLSLRGDGVASQSLEGLNSLERVDAAMSLNNVNGDLEVFSKLVFVGDEVLIEGGNATTLKGLRNIKYLKGLKIKETKLARIEAFDSIGALDKSISVDYNTELVSLEGLRNLSRIGGSLSVHGNPSLTSLADLSRLEAVGDYVEISRNESLRSLEGLSGIRSLNALYISRNKALVNLDPILGLEYVKDDIEIKPFTLCQSSNVANHAGKPVTGYCSQPPPVPEPDE